MMELQNPIKGHCDSMTDDLKRVTKAQKAFAKTLDKVRRSHPACYICKTSILII